MSISGKFTPCKSPQAVRKKRFLSASEPMAVWSNGVRDCGFILSFLYSNNLFR